MTSRVWNRDQGKRSSRAGIRLRIEELSLLVLALEDVVAMLRS
ncbi:MAG TPA: hypothetical protein VH478_08230 [Trebonia sp.]|jgi:hypothetical protein|nr:hypothetical protein [Trebonia sp.]